LRKISYKKLWKLLIDKELNKTQLAEEANVSGSTITRIAKGECVNLESIVKICNTLECEIQDIIELIPE
jgi:DNA-binding Xre family transcriptional regulator